MLLNSQVFNQVSQFFVFGLICALIVGCSGPIIKKHIPVPSKKGVTVSSVQVNKFKSGYHQSSDQMRRTILGAINNAGHITVRDRGAEATLDGRMEFGRLKRDQWAETHKSDGKTYYSYHYKLQKTLTVSYELKIGNRIIADTHQWNYKDEWSSNENYSKAIAKAPSEKDIKAHMMKQVAGMIVRDISPHQTLVKFKFLDGDDENIELANKYVKKERYDQAISILRQVVERTPEIEDRAVATYNLGLIHEMQGKHMEAFEYYRDANQMDLARDEYIDALTQAEKRYKINQAYKAQTGQ